MLALGGILILLTIPMMLARKEDPLDKLKRSQIEGSANKDGRLRPTAAQAGQCKARENTKAFLEPKSEEELSSVRLTLMQAGYPSRDAVRAYSLGPVGAGHRRPDRAGVYLLRLCQGHADGATTQDTLMYTLGPGAIGYMLPKYWVTRRVETRKEEITQGFPDSLDMMLVCVEAGQSLDQSIVRVAKESCAPPFPALADEYEIVAHEMKAGKDKAQVLSDMGERCGVQDVSSFVTVLIQSTTFGTSIADALRVYAGEMRDKRVMRAEEAANKLPTKMTLATMMLTVPPLLLILVSPSVVGIMNIGQ